MFLYDISAFMRHSIFYFSMNLVIFYAPFSIMTSPRYHDVTHFLTDPNEICTIYVKLKIKDILFVRNFLIFGIFIEKIMIYYKNYIYCIVTLHLSPHPLWAAH